MSNNYISTYVIDVSDNEDYTVQQLLTLARNGAALVASINAELGGTSWQTGTPSGASIVSAINTELGGSTWQAGAGDGDFVGPASSVDSQIVLFNGSTGKLGKATTSSGIAKLVSGVLSVVDAPTGNIVGTTALQTLTGKRVKKRVTNITSSLTPTADVSLMDKLNITALAANANIEEPIGTPGEGDQLMYAIKDDGTPRVLTWDAIFREGVATLPVITAAGKTTYVLCEYNATDSVWDVLAVGTTE